MSNARTIGLDLAKHVFQAHGAEEAGEIAFRKRLRRDKVLEFFASQPRCLVAMEACGGAHHWAREISMLGHEVRLIPASYVKPFVKRQKNDMVDAEAICEAAQRPTMRFVTVKSEEQQAGAVVFRARDILVRQRTQLINALRGHLAEYGMVVAQGPSHVARLISQVEDPSSGLPDAARLTLNILIEALKSLDDLIRRLDAQIARRAKEDEVARRLTTIPGIGPVTATALAALAPAAETFRKGRDFAAWMGLTLLQRSTVGKQKLGLTSKMGERTLRRLLICKSRYSICQTVSDDSAPTALFSVPRPGAPPSSPAPPAPRYAAAGLDRSARPRDPPWCRRRGSVRVARDSSSDLIGHCLTNLILILQLIIGASSVVQQATRRGTPTGTWLAQMLQRKPRMLVVVTLANKMARTVWALLAKGETYRSPTVAASS